MSDLTSDDTESRQFLQAVNTSRAISGGRLVIERSAKGLWRIEFGSNLPEADSCTPYFNSIAEAACEAMECEITQLKDIPASLTTDRYPLNTKPRQGRAG